VLVGLALAAIVRRPIVPSGPEAVRGPRVFRTGGAPMVREIAGTLADTGFIARAQAGGWDIDGRPAEPATADALGDLCDALVRLRAVDTFRPRDQATYGLDRPRGTVTLRTARGTRRLVLGDLNAAGSAVYARRDADPRVMQVGTQLLSQLERVLYHRDRSRPRDAGPRE
jgi:hypothetical protein